MKVSHSMEAAATSARGREEGQGDVVAHPSLPGQEVVSLDSFVLAGEEELEWDWKRWFIIVGKLQWSPERCTMNWFALFASDERLGLGALGTRRRE